MSWRRSSRAAWEGKGVTSTRRACTWRGWTTTTCKACRSKRKNCKMSSPSKDKRYSSSARRMKASTHNLPHSRKPICISKSSWRTCKSRIKACASTLKLNHSKKYKVTPLHSRLCWKKKTHSPRMRKGTTLPRASWSS